MPVGLRCRHDREVGERAADLFACGRAEDAYADPTRDSRSVSSCSSLREWTPAFS